MADELDPHRLDGLFEIGVDEISWREHHNYLTLVANHRTGKVVWGGDGKNAATLDPMARSSYQRMGYEDVATFELRAAPDSVHL